MPSVLDELLAESAGTGPCIFGAWLAAIDRKPAADFTTGLANPDISTAALTRVAKRHGYEGAEGVVRKHRVGTCTCPK